MSNPTQDLLNRPPEDLLLWVRGCIDAEAHADEHINWHGLADGAATRSHARDASPAWAETSVAVYAWLAAKSAPGVARSLRLSEMHVRAREITTRGACAGHGVRDPLTLIEWFRSQRKFSLDEATALSRHWRSLPITEMAALRHIKNMLGALKALPGTLTPADRDELVPWLELRHRLP